MIKFTGWEKGVYGTFQLESVMLQPGIRAERILIAHEGNSFFLYEIARPAKWLGYKIAVPATGEEVYFEIYSLDSKGIQYLMLEREL